MPILGKLKNMFSGGSSNSGDGRKKSKFPYIKQELDPNECWDIVGELGDGAFGKVYKAQNKQKREFAALKQVDINNESELEDYSVEIDILVQCKHKNVVGLYESFLFGGKLWMFIEFCELGALDTIMLELDKPLTEPQIQYISHEMCEGLDFLHQNFIIHRDLKAGNVLLTQDGGVRLADFGVSAKNTSLKQKRDSYIGTPYWMAPEVILCETIKDCPYDFRADIWSFGITLIEFSQIEPPNHEMHPMRVVLKIQKSDPPTLKLPYKWSKDFNDFIAKCLVKDPEKRLTTAELLQHRFIKDVKNKDGILDLISELGAEITLEEKDIEEDLDIDAATDSDTSSLSKINEGSCVDVPRIVLDSCQDEIIGDVKLKESIVKVDDSGVEGLKPDSLTKIASSSSVPTEQKEATATTEDETKDEFEGVIFRDKKNKTQQDNKPSKKEDMTPSPEPKSGQSEANKKKYRSLTKTRKFLVNGEVVTSKVQKLISRDGEEKQKEHKLWKADLRELKMLHRMENRQLQDLEFKSQQAIEEQMKRFEQDELTSRNMYEANLDMLSKQHKQHVDKVHSTHANERKSLMKKIKLEQDRDLKSFNERLKQEMKLLKQEVEMLPKEARKEAMNSRRNAKEVEQQDKQQKFHEKQKKHLERSMTRLEDQQAEQYALSEKQFLQQKQQIVRAKEEALWDMEEKHMMERYQLAEQLLKNKFILKRSLMMQRHSKETDQVKRINACNEDELLACHAMEWKRLPKILKSDAKTRTLMYRESIRISVINITMDEEREKIKKFEEMEKKRAKEERARLEAKHKRQLDDLRTKNNNLVKELEQVQCDKQHMLLENEMQKTAELGNTYRAELSGWKEELGPKKKKLQELFTSQLAEQEKLLSARDYQAAHAITNSASVTPVLRKKFPQSFLFGRISDQNTEEEPGILVRENSLRSSKRSSTLGGLAEKFRDSVRLSFVNLPDEDRQVVRCSDQVAEGALVEPAMREMSGREGEGVEKVKEEKFSADATIKVLANEGERVVANLDNEEQVVVDLEVSNKEERISEISFNSSNQEANVESRDVIVVDGSDGEKKEDVNYEQEVTKGLEVTDGQKLDKDDNESSINEIIDLHYNFDDNRKPNLKADGLDDDDAERGDDIDSGDNQLVHETLKSESQEIKEDHVRKDENNVIASYDKCDDEPEGDDEDDDEESGLTYDDNDIACEMEKTNEEISTDEKVNTTRFIGHVIEVCVEEVLREISEKQEDKIRQPVEVPNEQLHGGDDNESRGDSESEEVGGDGANVRLASIVESLKQDDDTLPKGDGQELVPPLSYKDVDTSCRQIELPSIGDECQSILEHPRGNGDDDEIQPQLTEDHEFQCIGDLSANDLGSPGESKTSDSIIDTSSLCSPPNSSDVLSDLVNTYDESVHSYISVEIKLQNLQLSKSVKQPSSIEGPENVSSENNQTDKGSIIPGDGSHKEDESCISEDEGCCVEKSESGVPSKTFEVHENQSEA